METQQKTFDISLLDIVKTLGLKQRDSLLDLRPKEDVYVMDVPKFILDENVGDEMGLYLGMKGGNSDFITQLLRVVNPKFQLCGNSSKIVKEFRNRLALDLDRLQLYKNFGYNRDNNFSRSKVYDTLINSDIACVPNMMEGGIFMSIMKYLADYFDINIVIYKTDYKFEILLDTSFYISKRATRLKIDKTLPIVEFIYNIKFYPIIDKKDCGVRKWNNRLEKTFQSEKLNMVDDRLISKMKMTVLSELAEKNGVSLKKKSDKTHNLIKKNKRELYNELFYTVDLIDYVS